MGSPPFEYNVPRQMSRSELMRAIRADIADEIEAINIYMSHYDATDDERVRAVLLHIVNEEKEHLAEFTQLLTMYDSFQAQKLREAPEDVAEVLENPPSPDGEAPLQSTPSRPPSTVGSMLGQGQAG